MTDTAVRGSYADHAAEFQTKSEELAEALEPTFEEITILQREYFEWKFGVAYVNEATAEALSKDDYEQKLAGLNTRLRAYVEKHGTIPKNGDVPALKIQQKNKEHADAPALLEREPDIFYALVAARAITIDCKLAAKVLNPDQAGRFKALVHKLGAGDALTFERVTA